MFNSRELFEDFKEQLNTRGLTDIQRAARFFIMIKTSYGSNRRNYGCVKRDINVTIEYLTKIQERLSKVVIENSDFKRIIKIYDKLGALLYLDPPYYGTEKYYDTGFNKESHIELRDALKNIKGKCIVSYNDCEFIRELYKDFRIEEISRNNNLVARYEDKDKSYKEIIIRNY